MGHLGIAAIFYGPFIITGSTVIKMENWNLTNHHQMLRCFARLVLCQLLIYGSFCL